MRKLLLVPLLLLGSSLFGQNQPTPISVTYVTKSTGAQGLANPGLDTHSGYTKHTIAWQPISAASVTGCSVEIDSSPDGVTWTALVGPEDCTSPGTDDVTASPVSHVRIWFTAITGGQVSATYTGVDEGTSTSAGGGGSGCVPSGGSGQVLVNDGSGGCDDGDIFNSSDEVSASLTSASGDISWVFNNADSSGNSQMQINGSNGGNNEFTAQAADNADDADTLIDLTVNSGDAEGIIRSLDTLGTTVSSLTTSSNGETQVTETDPSTTQNVTLTAGELNLDSTDSPSSGGHDAQIDLNGTTGIVTITASGSGAGVTIAGLLASSSLCTDASSFITSIGCSSSGDAVITDPTGDQTIANSDTLALVLSGSDGTSYAMKSNRLNLESTGNPAIIQDVTGEAELEFFGTTTNSETDFITSGNDFSIIETSGNLTLDTSAGAGVLNLNTGTGGIAVSGVAPELLLTDTATSQTISINPADPGDGNAPTITIGTQSDGVLLFEDSGSNTRGVGMFATDGSSWFAQLVGGEPSLGMSDPSGNSVEMSVNSATPIIELIANNGGSSGTIHAPAGNPIAANYTLPDGNGVFALVGDALDLNPTGDQTINTANGGGDVTFYGGHSAPAAPTVGTSGTTGATTYGYKITLATPTGETIASSETQITSGNAVLDGTNFNTIDTPTCGGVANCTFNIYATTIGGNIASAGLIAINIAASSTYNHQGAQGISLFPAPSSDTSSGIYNDGNITINSDFRLVDTSSGSMAWISPNILGSGVIGFYLGPQDVSTALETGAPYIIFENSMTNGPIVSMENGAGELEIQVNSGGIPEITANSNLYTFPTIAGQFAVGSLGVCSNVTGCGNGTVTFVAPLWRVGDFTLSGGSKTLNTMPYSSGTSYFCSGNDLTTPAGIISFTYSSGTNLTITETGGVATDHVRIMCAGS